METGYWIVESTGGPEREPFAVIRIAVHGMPEAMQPTK